MSRYKKAKDHKLKLPEYIHRSFEVICVLFTKSFVSRTKALTGIRKKTHRQNLNLKSACTYP